MPICGYSRDNFYKMNQSNFFRNRKWSAFFTSCISKIDLLHTRLHLEFPELVQVTEPKVFWRSVQNLIIADAEGSRQAQLQ